MPKIVLVGEAWGAQEEFHRKPFVGAAGQELTRMLEEAGIDRSECLVTNVFNFRPRDNDLANICCPKRELPKGYHLSSLGGKLGYVRPEFLPELDRLKSELLSASPNIVIALGNTATWALTGKVGIDRMRGAICESTLVPGLKVMPTYHPAAILRVYNRRPITILDLIKAKQESDTGAIRRRIREFWIEPSLRDLDEFWEKHLRDCELIAFDIENPGGPISCVSLAPSPEVALVIPFEDPRKPAGNYWETLKEERLAWEWLKMVLESPVPKLAQNGLYDIQHLWRAPLPIRVRHFEHDTMLLHHAIMLEEKKGLDVLGSLYANEDAWKRMRDHTRKSVKRES